MSIEKRSDLFREYARVIDMCEGTGVSPEKCVRSHQVGRGSSFITFADGFNPGFTDAPNIYDFAVAIVGGKPMFVGDVVISDGMQLTFISKTKIDVNPDPRTWNKPEKRTFTLAGHELPMPSKTITQCHVYAGRRPYYFDDPADRYAFEDALNAIIHEAMQK